uniref:elongation factor 2-like n=1 Tax=Erigeron canadensis TaxID=72917 RepID=UPI001CB9D206|nr:elongation factor 2-like [Erigeron canadensis]
MRVEVECKVASDLPKFVEGLRRLGKADSILAKMVSAAGVPYRETIVGCSPLMTARSYNSHNRLNKTTRPMPAVLVEAIDDGTIGLSDEAKDGTKILLEQNQLLAKQIWSYGPDGCGPNMLLDQSKGVHYLKEIKD